MDLALHFGCRQLHSLLVHIDGLVLDHSLTVKHYELADVVVRLVMAQRGLAFLVPQPLHEVHLIIHPFSFVFKHFITLCECSVDGLFTRNQVYSIALLFL